MDHPAPAEACTEVGADERPAMSDIDLRLVLAALTASAALVFLAAWISFA